jgi:hypothetical protein
MEDTAMMLIPTDTAELAVHPALADLPVRVDRKAAAALVKRFFFTVSERSLEIWPLDWVLVNSKAHCETADLFAVAQAKLAAAPVTRTARRQAA